MKNWSLFLTAALFGTQCLWCQQSIAFATVSGYAEDSSGAAIGGLLISITNKDRNQTSSSSSGDDGRYRFGYLPAGNYELSVTDPRFVQFQRSLALSVGQALDVPIRLSVAGQSDSIVVTDTPIALEAARTQISDTVVPREIDSLPLNGRNYMDLALLVPGVSRTNTGASQQFAETSAVPGTGISIAGQRNLNNTFVVDGLSSNDDAAALAGTFFSQEVIRDFQVITSGGNAEFGRASSGIINIATKSGSNDWHGRLYSFLRNGKLDARNPLAVRKDPLTQVQYGASLGGDLRRDRTFLFSNFEQTRRNAVGFTTIAPANVTAINSRLDTFGYGGPRVSTGEFPTGWDTTNYFVRLDHQLKPSHQLIARYSLYDIVSENVRSAGGLNAISRATRSDDRDNTVALSLVSTVSPRFINEGRVQFTRSRLSAPGNDLIGPAVSISGVANFGASTTSPVGRDNDLYEASDSITIQHGKHFLKAGFNYVHNRLNIFFPGSRIAAVYGFSSLPNFNAGIYNTFQQAFGDPNQFQSNPNTGFFLQDEWRPIQQLTIHMGLRYDLQFLPQPIQIDRDNIAPRVGMSFAPGDRRTVVRASYGLYYDRIPLRATSNALQRDGSKYRVALFSFGQSGAPVFPAQLSNFPEGQFINITTIDPRVENSYAHQASFQVEREIGSSSSVSVGYQWTRSLHLILSRNVNVPTLTAAQANALGIPNLGRPDSRYGNISRYESSGDSYYNGLLLSVRSKPATWTEFRVSYNYSKTIDNVGNFFFSSPQNNFDLRDDRGLSDNHQRHRLTVSGVLESPRQHLLLRGWQLAPMFLYTSALPFNIQTGNDRNNDTNANDRPVGIGRNTGRGFSFMSLDARLSRTFRLTESWTLQALVESFNSLNRTNRMLPNNVFGPGTTPNATFGRATGVYDPRQIQAGLRLSF